MVRNSEPWDLGEPELNDRGQPVIHNIAQKLGCIRPNSDIDLPVHSVFPEDEASMADLARQLEAQPQNESTEQFREYRDTDSPMYRQDDRASSSELDHSDFEDYRRIAFGGSQPLGLSPQSFAASTDFDLSPTQPTASSFSTSSPSMTQAPYPTWTNQPTNELAMHFLQQARVMPSGMDMLSQGLVESEFGIIKPHVLSCPNPEVMMGMGDPMIYSGYEGEPMRI